MSTLSRAPLLFALLALAPACSTTVETNETGGSGGGSAEPTPPAPPSQPESDTSHCGFGHGKETVLVASQGNDLVFVRDDGSHFVGMSFPKAQGGTDESSIQLSVAGGFVAAIGFAWGSPQNLQGRAALLDRDGHVLFSKDFDHAAVDTVFVSDKGDAVFGDSSTGRTILAHADGSHQIVDAVVPMGPPDATGHFPAAAGPIGDAAIYGWASAAEPLQTLALGGAGVYPLLAGDQLVYLGEQNGTPVFVRETPSSIKTFAFPLSDMVASVSDATSDGWVALRGGSPERTFIAAPGAGAKHVKVPAGQKPFGMASFDGMRLSDDAGELLFIGRDGTRGGLFHTLDHGASWTPVGPSFSKITSLATLVRGGTYILAATDEQGYFQVDPWDAPTSAGDAPDHVGPAVFAVRPGDGIQRKLPIHAGLSTNITLDPSGLCAAFTDVDGALHGFDVKTGHGGALLDAGVGQTAAWLR
jgi:hypothetical protein